MNYFASIEQEPEDPIYGLQVLFKKDPRPEKINLSIGTLPNSDGKAFKFASIAKAEANVHSQNLPKDYLPIDGYEPFRLAVQELIVGPKKENSRAAYTAQAVGGTGALYIAGQFLARHITKTIFISDPTWVNHRKLFTACGLEVFSYPYVVAKNGALDIQHLLNTLYAIPIGSAVCLQASCHNPTGIDPTLQEWKEISRILKTRNHIALFDIAYLGLGTGLEDDLAPIRLFFEEGHEMLIASSFSKNMGLYGERVGALTIACHEKETLPIASQIRKIIRTIYSSPPSHGAYIAAECLRSHALRGEWHAELHTKRAELDQLRSAFYQEMEKYRPHDPFTALKASTGLFSICRLTKSQVLKLRDENAIYLAEDGRINIAALPHSRELLHRIVHAIAHV